MSTCQQAQGFAKNYNPSYAEGGLIGHTGIDINCGYGSVILSAFKGYIYKVLTKSNPSNDGTGFTGVFMIVDDGIECFEWLVGHCNPTVSPMNMINQGEMIGTEANNGKIYSGNVEITLTMQWAGDHRGEHRHYQKRPLIPRPYTEPNKSYIASQQGSPFYYNNRYYEIPAYNNGFNGCVDPTITIFQRDLFLGRYGYDVFVLQRILVKNRLLSVEPTGFFGPSTFTALRQYQSLKGITPIGYMGTKTRTVILTEMPGIPNLLAF